ncbi:valine--tRNA ligase [Clostridium sp. CAG:571]|nr:valine--tRNA ligase [Clostridium sp. CAG:571]HJJ06177.1 valine--tRNA ligase [Clostridiaceae bacterium]
MKNHELNEKYNPKDFEERLYQDWEEKGYFKPSMDKTKEAYSIMMPPPNVTGKLHMGHALDATIQDFLIRYKRMQGFNTLWLPGTDHAAISTEMKVVQKLREKGKKKSDLTREEFLKEAWDWTKEYGGTIQKQQRKMGCSCDWDRSRFTLDEGLSKAVETVFLKLYEKGYIYKGKRMINWCPNCKTSISDAEVEYKEEASHIWYIKYQIKDSDEYLVVATTRPETMLGDTGVAVNPKDARFKHLIGKKCILPIMNKEIPIIADPFVDMEFGTGCVKLTPCHDPNDYQAGIKNNLEFVEVFDSNLIMNDLIPEVKGMNAYEARNIIVNMLKDLGCLIKIEDYTHNVAKCERCKTTIEPTISDQWFVKMDELAKPAIEAVKSGDIKFIPSKYDKTYFNWMENLHDWCISRQLYWGHRIPAYYCKECGNIHVASKMPEQCSKCGCKELVQDPDTLDTWFSSALWPFSTLGWPEETEDLKTFYPTNTLVTGYDIISLWVSRMIFSGLEYLGKKPFSDVIIHGMVRDEQGRKMSKTLGNGVDPLQVIDEYGADALRFSLVLGISFGNDIRYIPAKVEQGSNFANKLWNASKFVLMNLKDYDGKYDLSKLAIEDKWILSKANKLAKEMATNIDNYDLGVATQKIYDFIWNEFCDWYIEIVKTRLYDKECLNRKEAMFTLNTVLEYSLKMLHPIMPFVTEEIYTKLYNNDESIMISEWPKYKEKLNFAKEEDEIEMIKSIIGEIRNIRNNMNVHPSRKSKLICVTEKYDKLIEESKEFLKKLGFANEIIIQKNKKDIPENSFSIIQKDLEIYIPFEDLVDIEAEKERLEKEKERLEKEVLRGEKMLSNPGFINKAPESKVKEEKEKLSKYKEMLENTIERLNGMK